MSARYSSSPELHLQIGDSRLRRWSLAALLACLVLALGLIFYTGYPVIASALSTCALCLLPALWRNPSRGLRLRWRQGQLALGRGDALTPVELLPCTACLPWGVYLCWRDPAGGSRAGCWLFVDSLSAEDLRRLRFAILLQR